MYVVKRHWTFGFWRYINVFYYVHEAIFSENHTITTINKNPLFAGRSEKHNDNTYRPISIY